jgi:hypothetical protein
MFEDSSWIDAVHSCSDPRGYWWSAFSTSGHPFRRLLAVLSGLNSTKMVREFDMVGDYDLEPVHSVNGYPPEALLHVRIVSENGSGGAGTNFCSKGLFPNGSASVGGIGDVRI